MSQGGSEAKGHGFELNLDLGGEQILLSRVETSEALSQPFSTTLEIIAAHAEIDLLPHLGKLAIVKTFRENDEDERYFSGYVVASEFTEESEQGFHYRLELAPYTYFMDQNRSSRTFHKKSAKAIIEQLCGSTVKIESKLTSAGLEQREYVVQYGESDFAFLTRLMEREGIYYYWTHSSAGPRLVLAEGPSGHSAAKREQLKFSRTSASVASTDLDARFGGESADAHLYRWTQRASTTGQQKVRIRALPVDAASTPTEKTASASKAHDLDAGERYAWHSGLDSKDFEALAADQAQSMTRALRSQRVIYVGESQMTTIAVGTKVKVSGHPSAFMNGDFLVVRSRNAVSAGHYRTGQESGGSEPGSWFEAIPADTPFKVVPTAPIPYVPGLDTAIVTDGADATDPYGRVKIKFMWDNEAAAPSRWVRVAQHGGMGNIVMPRKGEEVLVSYLNGDPDYPVVVGHVFNSQRKPAYELPKFSHRAVWRNENEGGGGAGSAGSGIRSPKMSGTNELSFENDKGKEEILLHAIRNLNTRVHENETHFVAKDQEIQIDGARKLTVEQNETITVTGSITETANGEITIESKARITLKVGGSSIVIDPVGITLKSTMITEEAQAMHKIKTTMLEADGGALMTLKAGMIMIN